MNLAELLQLEWRAPAWGLIALMPLLFALLARWRKQQWNRYAEPHLQAWALRQGAALQHNPWRIAGQWGFWLLLACALAGPRLPLETLDGTRADVALSPNSLPQAGERDLGSLRELHRHDMDLMIVLDVSPSMAALDVAPSRLARAKLKLQDLAARLHGERIGLIAFSGEAGLLLPLTRDTQVFDASLTLANEKLFEDRGSYLAAALDLARKNLSDTTRSRAVLLLSDSDANSLSGAAGNAAINAARALKTAHIPLYVLAIASDSGAAIPLAEGGTLQQDGAPVISRPDLAGYQALVSLSGGSVAQVSDGDSDLNSLYQRGILALPASKGGLDKTRTWRELFTYPLALALLLLLANNLRWSRRSALVAAALVASSGAQADDAAWREAHQAYTQKQYLVAQQLYRQLSDFDARMGEGAAAYRRKDYAYASQQFTQALLQASQSTQRADALFNLGDSYFYAGNVIAAADAFEGVLHYRPNDQRAKENLGRARGKLVLRNSTAPQQNGIPGRKGRDLGDGEANEDSPLGMKPEKDETRPMVDFNSVDAENAKRLGVSAHATMSELEANRRAALKKLDLLSDQRAAMFKEILKQDATREPPTGMSPW